MTSKHQIENYPLTNLQIKSGNKTKSQLTFDNSIIPKNKISKRIVTFQSTITDETTAEELRELLHNEKFFVLNISTSISNENLNSLYYLNSGSIDQKGGDTFYKMNLDLDGPYHKYLWVIDGEEIDTDWDTIGSSAFIAGGSANEGAELADTTITWLCAQGDWTQHAGEYLYVDNDSGFNHCVIIEVGGYDYPATANVIIQCEIYNYGDVDGGLCIRSQGTDATTYGYSYDMMLNCTQNTIYFYKNAGGSLTTLKSWIKWSDGSSIDFSDSTNYTMKVIAQGNRFDCYVDNSDGNLTFVGTVYDDTYQVGWHGVADQSTTGRFDDFSLKHAKPIVANLPVGAYDYNQIRMPVTSRLNDDISADGLQRTIIAPDNPITFKQDIYQLNDPSLIVDLQFDEGMGSTTYDQSGNGNNGTITGARWEKEFDGKRLWNGLRFDLTDDTDVEITANTSIDVGGRNAITCEVYLKGGKIGTVGHDYIMHAGYDWILLLEGDERIKFYLHDNTNSHSTGAAGIVYTAATYENQWFHIIGTFQDSVACIYVNGILIDTDTDASGHTIPDDAGSIHIGQRKGGTRDSDDFIAFARIYNRALTATEVKTKYDALSFNESTGGEVKCVSDDTRILTKDGFKYFYDLSYDDEIATLNKDEYLEYHKPEKIISYEYDGDMIHFIGGISNHLVTPDHAMYIRESWNHIRHNKGFYFQDAKDLIKRNMTHIEFKKDTKWIGNEIKEYMNKPIELWLEFMGWYLSEGWTSSKTNEISITQSEKRYANEIRTLIKNINYPLNEKIDKRYNAISFRCKNKKLASYLRQFGKAKDKFVPQIIKDLSPRLIKIFLIALFKGDGTHRENGDWESYCTISPKLRDDVQELLLKIGLSSSVLKIKRNKKNSKHQDSYMISVNHTNLTPKINSNNRKQPYEIVPYKGKVYDVTVPNHTIFLERNGKVMWTGNCWDTRGEDSLWDYLEFHAKLNEGTGTAVYDSSKNNRAVTENSWATADWSASSYNKWAKGTYHFDGVGDRFYFDLDGEDFDSHGWSIGCWFNADSTSDGESIFSCYDTTLVDYILEAYWNTNNLRIKISSTGADGQWTSSGYTFNTGQWYFLVFTWSGDTSDAPIIYVNGETVTMTEDAAIGAAVYDTDNFNFGVSGQGWWDGYLDDCFIYSTVLSADRIKWLYENMPRMVVEEGYEDIQGWQRVYCYDEKTKLLTKEGFKYFNDLKEKDLLATLNLETDEIEYHKATEHQKFYYEGEMIQFGGKKGSYSDLLVTPDHDMIVRKDYIKNKEYKKIKAKDLITKSLRHFEWKKTGEWIGQNQQYKILSKLICKNNLKGLSEKQISFDSWASFLGWYIAEGSCTRNHWRTNIAQSKENNRKEIINVIEQMNLHPIIDKYSILIDSKQLVLELEQFGYAHEKFVPQEIKDSSPEIIELFLNSYFKGDGSPKGNYKWGTACTISKRLAEDIIELLLKVGKSGTLLKYDKEYLNKNCSIVNGRKIISRYDQYRISVNNTHLTPSIQHVEKIKYKGYVYDVTVPNHSLFVMRNGKVCWSGNSTDHHFVGDMIVDNGLTRLLQYYKQPDGNASFWHQSMLSIIGYSDGIWNENFRFWILYRGNEYHLQTTSLTIKKLSKYKIKLEGTAIGATDDWIDFEIHITSNPIIMIKLIKWKLDADTYPWMSTKTRTMNAISGYDQVPRFACGTLDTMVDSLVNGDSGATTNTEGLSELFSTQNNQIAVFIDQDDSDWRIYSSTNIYEIRNLSAIDFDADTPPHWWGIGLSAFNTDLLWIDGTDTGTWAGEAGTSIEWANLGSTVHLVAAGGATMTYAKAGYPAGSYRAFILWAGTAGTAGGSFTTTGGISTTTIADAAILDAGEWHFIDFIADANDTITFSVTEDGAGATNLNVGEIVVIPISNSKNLPLDLRNQSLSIEHITESCK